MSWNINTKGTAKNVAAVIEKEQYMPDSLKAAIIQGINANTGQNGQPARVVVETSGHVGYGSGYFTVSIRNYEPEEAPEIPEPAPAADETPAVAEAPDEQEEA